MQNFTEGLLVALQGILIVFAVLIILMLVLNIMKLFAKDETKPAQKAAPTQPAPAAVAPIADSDETVAVISAAVAAMSGDDVTKRLRVMSIKRQGSELPIWSAPKK